MKYQGLLHKTPHQNLRRARILHPDPPRPIRYPGVSESPKIFLTYSLTKGCPKCEAIRRIDETNTVHHNKECRTRIEQCMSQDAEHSQKLKEIENRQNKYLARRVDGHEVGRADVNGDMEFTADYMCHECTPSEENSIALAAPAAGGETVARRFTTGLDSSPTAGTSKGGGMPQWTQCLLLQNPHLDVRGSLVGGALQHLAWANRLLPCLADQG